MHRIQRERWAPHRTFGLRQEWVELFVNNPQSWSHSSSLGPMQIYALKAWLITCDLIASNGEPSRIAHLISVRKPVNLGWQLSWVNTVFSFIPAMSYVKLLFIHRANSGELLSELTSEFPGRSIRTLRDGVSELISLFDHTPIGSDLGQGVIIQTRPRTVQRVGLTDPYPEALAHATRRLFQREGCTELLLNEDLAWPWVVFGCNREETLLRLRGIQGEWLRVKPEAIELLVTWEELDELALY